LTQEIIGEEEEEMEVPLMDLLATFIVTVSQTIAKTKYVLLENK
jgi:hypothetical protein